MDNTELRIAQQLADAGMPRLAIERLSLDFLDLGARLDDLERRSRVRQATPEEFAEHAREWEKDFPGSSTPTVWQLPMMGRK